MIQIGRDAISWFTPWCDCIGIGRKRSLYFGDRYKDMLGGKDGKLHIGMAGIFCIEYRQAKYCCFSSPITSLFFVKVLLAVDAAGNAPQLLTL